MNEIYKASGQNQIENIDAVVYKADKADNGSWLRITRTVRSRLPAYLQVFYSVTYMIRFVKQDADEMSAGVRFWLEEGKTIQDAFPALTGDERELIMSGYLDTSSDTNDAFVVSRNVIRDAPTA